MSEDRVTIGLIGELATAIPEDHCDVAHERLEEIDLRLNSEGTFVCQIHTEGPLIDNFGIHFLTNWEVERNRLHQKVSKLGFHIHPDNIHPFVDLWYDGAESNHEELTVKKFRELTKQKDVLDA
ncbi:MAG: hypothetical protein AB3N07_00705 [Ruegeria sp.]